MTIDRLLGNVYTPILQSFSWHLYILKGVTHMLRNFFAREEGQGLVEYALILVLIAIVVIGILTVLGNQVSSVFGAITGGLEDGLSR